MIPGTHEVRKSIDLVLTHGVKHMTKTALFWGGFFCLVGLGFLHAAIVGLPKETRLAYLALLTLVGIVLIVQIVSFLICIWTKIKFEAVSRDLFSIGLFILNQPDIFWQHIENRQDKNQHTLLRYYSKETFQEFVKRNHHALMTFFAQEKTNNHQNDQQLFQLRNFLGEMVIETYCTTIGFKRFRFINPIPLKI